MQIFFNLTCSENSVVVEQINSPDNTLDVN